MNTTDLGWEERFRSIRPECLEGDVRSRVIDSLLEELGFRATHRSSTKQFKSVDRLCKEEPSTNIIPDYTCWEEGGSKHQPYLVVEAKQSTDNIASRLNCWKTARRQIKYQMRASRAKFGLICNGRQMQLFQRHGRVIAPRTKPLDLSAANIHEHIHSIKRHLEKPRRALTVMCWNNRGGVGKTTLTGNMSSALVLRDNRKKVLVCNFDLQGDSNAMFGLPSMLDYKPKLRIYEALQGARDGSNDYNPIDLIRTKEYPCGTRGNGHISLDFIPGDSSMMEVEKDNLLNELVLLQLFDQNYGDTLLSESIYDTYDYIFIDSSPSWAATGLKSAYAADIMILPLESDGLSIDALKRIQQSFLTEEYFYPDTDEAIIPEIEACVVNSRARSSGVIKNILNRVRTTATVSDLNINLLNLDNFAEITKSSTKGIPLTLDRPDCPASKQFISIAEQIFCIQGSLD